LGIAFVYAVFNVWSQGHQRRNPGGRWLRWTHDVVDALALFGGAALTGGTRSAVALILYPHLVSVAVRGGLRYAVALGALDAGLMLALAQLTPADPLGRLHALALLWCALMAGVASAHVHEMQARVRLANRELSATNERLAASLAVGESARQEQTLAFERLLVSEERSERLVDSLGRLGQEFESLLDISRGILAHLELPELLPLITRSVNRVMSTQHCLLLLKDGELLRLAAHEGLEPEVAERFGELRMGESLSGRVAQSGQPLTVADMRLDPRTRSPEVAERYGYRSFLCVPLMLGSEVLGTLEVVTRELRAFSSEEQALMSAFADQAAVALENARLYQAARTHLVEVSAANRRLEELDRLREEYLRNVSHEFRTPLTLIKGYAEFLRDGPPPAEATWREVMRVLLESCDRLIDMVDTLLEVNRLEHGSEPQTLSVGRLDLRQVVGFSLDPLWPVAERKGVVLQLEVPETPLALEGDGGLLVHVVRKLVDNAIKYSAPGGKVAVRARSEGDRLSLQVEDAGIGIAAEHLPRIFEKFYMVDGGIARRSAGTGVGLYLVREIVKLHHGSVEVTSTLGSGSVFQVRLPVAHTPADPEALPA
jgi:signal transduction histidine kinase